MFVLKIDVDLILIIITFMMIGISLVYIFLDVHYFLRTIFTIWCARLFQSKIKLTDAGIIYGMCTTNDIDLYWQHMNNARYLREINFAQLNFFERTGFYSAILNINGFLLQNTTFIRYRRPILLFSSYKVITKLIYWNEKKLYFEHQFITLEDNFVCALVLSEQKCVGVNLNELISSILDKKIEERPNKPKELEYLGQCNAIVCAKIH